MNKVQPRKLDLYTGNDGYVYLASPYSHEDKEVMEHRHNASCVAAANLIDKGVILFAPIAQSATIVAHSNNLKSDWATWERCDRLFVLKSKAVYVLMLEGWKQSVGVKAEIVCASTAGIPVYYLDPNTLSLANVYGVKIE